MDSREITRKAVEKQQPATPYKLAQVLKVPPSTVTRWINGERTPRGSNLLKLLQIAGALKTVAILGFLGSSISLGTPNADASTTPPASQTAPMMCIM